MLCPARERERLGGQGDASGWQVPCRRRGTPVPATGCRGVRTGERGQLGLPEHQLYFPAPLTPQGGRAATFRLVLQDRGAGQLRGVRPGGWAACVRSQREEVFGPEPGGPQPISWASTYSASTPGEQGERPHTPQQARALLLMALRRRVNAG